MNKKEITKVIKRTLKDRNITVASLWDTHINAISYALEEEGLINFSVYLRSDDEGENWLQTEYFSKIGKSIIFDYDFPNSFESIEKMADKFIETQKEIDDFELRLSIQVEK